MQDNTIYTRQMAILIFLSSTAVKLSSLPALWARDISTSVFLAMIFMTLVEIVLFCLVYVFVERGGVELLDKSKIRYPVCVALYFFFFAKLFVFLAFMANFVTNFMFDSISLYIVIITLVTPISYLAIKGIRSIARCGEFFVFFSGVCLFLLLAFLDADFNFERLKPFLATDSLTTFKSGFGYGLWFGDALPFLFVKIKKSKKGVLPIFIGISYALICIITMLSIAIFGDALAIADNILVNLSVFNQLSAVLGRLQWLSIVPWTIGGFIEGGLVFWMFVAFILLFLVLAKWGWPVIIKMMDKRAATIDQGVEDARKAREQLDNAREEAKKYVREAQAKQSDMLREAAKMKTEIIEEARREAQEAAKHEMDQARQAIDQARKEAELQFRNEVGRFSIDIAEKMVREKMKDDKAQSKLVDKLLDEIEKN